MAGAGLRFEMDSKENVLTTLRFEEPERVPLLEAWIEPEIMNAIGDGDPFRTREVLGLDCMPVAVGHPESTNAWRTGVDEWGRVFRDGFYVTGKVREVDDLEKYTPSLEYVEAWFPDDMVERSRREYGGSHALYYATHDACLGLSYMSMGLSGFFSAMYRDRDLVESLIERSTEWTVEMVRKANELDVDFILMGDDVAFRNGPMVSPKMFRELVLPSYRRVVSASKVPIIWHSDGGIEPLLPMIVEAGFAGVHSLEPNAHIDLKLIKEEYGRKLVLAGNLDVSNVLTQSDTGLVRKDVERCIGDGAPGGGYIFSSSNSLFKGMSTEAILEAYRYAKQIGHYPATI